MLSSHQFSSIAYSSEEAQLNVCSKLFEQQQLNQCYANLYQKADSELTRSYMKLTNKMKDNNLLNDYYQLKNVQSAWLLYRENSCRFDAHLYEGGSMKPMVHAICLISETNHRLEMLQNLIREYGY
jgi:uncharacterized protein YecT (DUF1311 family)